MDRGMGDSMGGGGRMGGGGGMGGMDRSMGGGGGMGSGMGGSSSFSSPPGGTWSNSGGSSDRRSDSIMVRNLPLDCNWHTPKDRFNHAGDIKYAEMKERGVGLIRFGTERDAERAVSMMNGQRIDGRQIV